MNVTNLFNLILVDLIIPIIFGEEYYCTYRSFQFSVHTYILQITAVQYREVWVKKPDPHR
jgi:hypothetical protein